MRLFSLVGADAVNDGENTYEADADGCFDVPPELAMQLHNVYIQGQNVWETEGERQTRLIAEELQRRQDPATLLAAVEALTAKVEPRTRTRR